MYMGHAVGGRELLHLVRGGIKYALEQPASRLPFLAWGLHHLTAKLSAGDAEEVGGGGGDRRRGGGGAGRCRCRGCRAGGGCYWGGGGALPDLGPTQPDGRSIDRECRRGGGLGGGVEGEQVLEGGRAWGAR